MRVPPRERNGHGEGGRGRPATGQRRGEGILRQVRAQGDTGKVRTSRPSRFSPGGGGIVICYSLIICRARLAPDSSPARALALSRREKNRVRVIIVRSPFFFSIVPESDLSRDTRLSPTGRTSRPSRSTLHNLRGGDASLEEVAQARNRGRVSPRREGRNTLPRSSLLRTRWYALKIRVSEVYPPPSGDA